MNIVRPEKYYQKLLTAYYGHGHHRYKTGITDITTQRFHGEIKKWKCWKQTIGQLWTANLHEPRDDLRAFMFGQYKYKKYASQDMMHAGIQVYDIIHVADDYIYLLDMKTCEKIYIL